MGNKLFIGNLSFTINDSSLSELFAPFGTVESAKVITDRDSGRSKGFGFVEMSSQEEASKAIDQLNGANCEGRPLAVSIAKPMVSRDNRGGNRRNRY